MSKRLAGKVAVVVGAGQTPGATVGNGRATALRFAQEGAHLIAADRDVESARETVAMIEAAGGSGAAFAVDVAIEAELGELMSFAVDSGGSLDVLHYNVGVSYAAGDSGVDDLQPEAFQRVMALNLLGMTLAAKHALPIMRQQGRGAIVNVGSNSALIDHPNVGYKLSKAGVIALTEHLAIRNAPFGIRANVILPGLMDTPMAVERRIGLDGSSRDHIVAERAARVPLRGRGGSAWDVANAALFLASDEAAFISGASLVVDGAQALRAG